MIYIENKLDKLIYEGELYGDEYDEMLSKHENDKVTDVEAMYGDISDEVLIVIDDGEEEK